MTHLLIDIRKNLAELWSRS